MQISAYKSLESQGLLWDEPLGNHGHVRTIIGELIEELTATLVGGRRHKTQCTADYCPDISVSGRFYECKAVGNSKTAFVYAGRLDKDRRFTEQGNQLDYVIWHHTTESKLASTIGELQQLVIANMQAVYIVPFASIDLICSKLRREPLNSKYGHCKERPETYGSGYRIHLSLLEPWIHEQFFMGME